MYGCGGLDALGGLVFGGTDTLGSLDHVTFDGLGSSQAILSYIGECESWSCGKVTSLDDCQPC